MLGLCSLQHQGGEGCPMPSGTQRVSSAIGGGEPTCPGRSGEAEKMSEPRHSPVYRHLLVSTCGRAGSANHPARWPTYRAILPRSFYLFRSDRAPPSGRRQRRQKTTVQPWASRGRRPFGSMQQNSARTAAICRTFCRSVCLSVRQSHRGQCNGGTDLRTFGVLGLPRLLPPTISGDTPRFGDNVEQTRTGGWVN
ncbi:hypothetical protein LX32DRAFT_131380 [Colletotrichum zoysiae]|uniref:Uncharacterized protein n=1 Tax=Colletotrichum zoysiae TaxID=1216348 RepID=A0AAD9H9A8_9PEZI|nr:hypothetical protein LX32DRAFT_131380 [Colletotrichum zoysiae]